MPPALREILRELAQLVHVVGAQLGQDAGQQLVQLCMRDRFSASAHPPWAEYWQGRWSFQSFAQMGRVPGSSSCSSADHRLSTS